MESILTIATIIASLFLSALCLYLILLIVRVRETLGNVEKDLKEISTRVVPVLDNMEFITARVKSITENIDDQVTMVRDSVGSIREMTDNIVALERKVQERIEGPILETVALVAAIFKGVRSFMDRVRA